MLLNSTKNSQTRQRFLKLDKEFSSRHGLKKPAAREVDQEKDFPKRTCDLKGPKLNVAFRDKIWFVAIAHLMRNGKSCAWALYRSLLGRRRIRVCTCCLCVCACVRVCVRVCVCVLVTSSFSYATRFIYV